MRWMWIDRIVELVPGERLVAVKNVSLAEEHLHDHFEAEVDETGAVVRPSTPIMPASLMIEGMAQTAGILVGHAEGFREKVILAKVTRAEIDLDPTPGCVLRYTARVQSLSGQGASTKGEIALMTPGLASAPFEPIGGVDILFSHLDQNLAGERFPEHNFVFGESFKTLLRMSGVGIPSNEGEA